MARTLNGVAISGKAGSGKSTLAASLVDALRERGHDAYRCAFGDALKREVFDLYRVTKDHPDGRRLLIQHGELRRATDPLYWVSLLSAYIEHRGGFPVVDDVRFTNELAWALGRGFLTVRLEAPDALRALRIKGSGGDLTIVGSASVTETDLDRCAQHFHVVATNDGRVLLRDLVRGIASYWPAIAA